MIRRGVRVLVAAILLTHLVAAQTAAPVAVGSAAASQPAKHAAAAPRDIGEQLERLRAEHDLPAVAAVLIRDGRIAAAGAVGVRAIGHPERVTLDDQFHLGSCTKAMTAALCARLVQQGKLRWQSTVGELFPECADGLSAAQAKVTLEQLLTHQSGLPDDRAGGLLLLRIRMLSGSLREQRAELVRLAFAQPPADAPGVGMHYSNAGYAIAGAMAERAADRGYEQLMRDELFAPLQMKSAGFGPPGDGNDDTIDQPRGHRAGWFGGGLAPVPPSSVGADNPGCMSPAGAVHMSLPDWAKFAIDQLDAGKRPGGLLLPQTYEKLHTAPAGSDYAMGWGVGRRDGVGRVLSHAGSNTMWLALVVLAPERNAGVLVATNAAGDEAMKACRAVSETLLAEAANHETPGGAGRTP